MTLLFAILVFLFSLFCAVKAITDQRAKQSSYLKAADARREVFSAEYSALVSMMEKDKLDGLI